MAQRKRKIWRLVIYVGFYSVALMILGIILFPFVDLFFSSFKSLPEFGKYPPHLFPKRFSLQNYEYLFRLGSFGRVLFNSILVASFVTVLSLLIGSIAAFSIARFRFRGQSALSKFILFVYMFPSVLLVTPLFITIRSLGLVDSLWSLILADTTFALPFSIWMLVGFFSSIPKQLDEAARIDGCTHGQVLWRIIVPLARPGIAAAGAFSFLLSWSEFVFAITFIQSSQNRTLSAELLSLVGYASNMRPGVIIAGCVLAVVPVYILFLIIQRHIVDGLTLGAVKS
ncbi:MAG: carbohydrate ABC transporter permease [Firmicutes bacterium]|nr:carbohydrate ABC transporter permease [Bacillota bacterium]